MAWQCTYWTQCSANAGFVESIKFACPGDGPVNVGFHGDGGRDGVNGQRTVLGMRRMTALNGEFGRNRVERGPARGVLVDCCA